MKKKYVRILVNGKEMQAHRHIMEQHLCRKLDRWELVHHINDNSLDNRLENLQVVTAKEHNRIHACGKPRSPETREKIRQAKLGKTLVSAVTKLKLSMANRGESKPWSKLKEWQVVEIKRRIALGERQTKIALAYGVDAATINCIHTKRSWSYLPEPTV